MFHAQRIWGQKLKSKRQRKRDRWREREWEWKHFEQLFSLHSRFPGEISLRSLRFWSLFHSLFYRPESFSLHIRKMTASTLVLSARFFIYYTTTTTGRGEKRVTGRAREREGGEGEWDIPAGSRQFQAISSPSLGLCLQADINRILLLYLKLHPVQWWRMDSLKEAVEKKGYDLTAKSTRLEEVASRGEEVHKTTKLATR